MSKIVSCEQCCCKLLGCPGNERPCVARCSSSEGIRIIFKSKIDSYFEKTMEDNKYVE